MLAKLCGPQMKVRPKMLIRINSKQESCPIKWMFVYKINAYMCSQQYYFLAYGNKKRKHLIGGIGIVKMCLVLFVISTK